MDQKIIARGPEELSRSDRIIGVNPRVERGPGKEKWPKLCQMLLYSQGWRAGHWTEQSGIKKNDKDSYGGMMDLQLIQSWTRREKEDGQEYCPMPSGLWTKNTSQNWNDQLKWN